MVSFFIWQIESRKQVKEAVKMEQELDILYNELAQKIVSMIPVDWSNIYYLGEVENNQMSWSSVFYFKETSSNKFIKSHSIPETYKVSEQIYDELLAKLNSTLLSVYRCFGENNQPLWDQLTLSLNSDGKFNIDFLYDKIKDYDNGQVGREIIWAYDTFGFKPKEGTYTRKLLDSYLNSNDIM